MSYYVFCGTQQIAGCHLLLITWCVISLGYATQCAVCCVALALSIPYSVCWHYSVLTHQMVRPFESLTESFLKVTAKCGLCSPTLWWHDPLSASTAQPPEQRRQFQDQPLQVCWAACWGWTSLLVQDRPGSVRHSSSSLGAVHLAAQSPAAKAGRALWKSRRLLESGDLQGSHLTPLSGLMVSFTMRDGVLHQCRRRAD